MYRCKSWVVNKTDRKCWFIWNIILEESSTDTLDHQESEQVGPRANWACNIVRGKNDITKTVLLQAHTEKAGFLLGKAEGSRAK